MINSKKKRDVVVIFALLLLIGAGTFLRFYQLGYSPIWGDQSILYGIALDWVNVGKFPMAANKASAGAMNPPFVEYLLALPLFMQKTVMSPLWFQAILGVMALPILVVTGVKVFKRPFLPLIATFLFALNPWAIHYSRLIWNPSLIPFFTTLLFASVLLYLQSKRPLFLISSFIWLAIITQLHLSALVLLPVLLLIALIFWRRFWRGSWRQTAWPILLGIALFLLLYTPYLRYESGHNFADLRALSALLSGAELSGETHIKETTVNAASLLILFELAAGDNYLIQQTGEWQNSVPKLPYFTPLTRGIIVIALLYTLIAPIGYWYRHQPHQKLPDYEMGLLVTAVWSLIPILLYLRHSHYLQNYFFLYLLPATAFAIAAVFDLLLTLTKKASHRPLRYLWTSLLLLPLLGWGVWQFGMMVTGLKLADEMDISGNHTAVHLQEAVVTLRRIQAENPSCSITLFSEGIDRNASPVGLLEPFLYPSDVRLAVQGRGFLMPDGCTIYFISVETDDVARGLLDANGRLLQTIPTPHANWEIYYVDGRSYSQQQPPPLARWENGLALHTVETPSPMHAGKPYPLILTWHITTEQRTLADYHFFIHLLNDAGELIAQDDTGIVHPVYWREGDYMTAQFWLHPPADLPAAYSLHAGLYSWPSIERTPRLNGELTFVIETIE